MRNFFETNISILDFVYVVITTFTTVGFGDILHNHNKFADFEYFALLIIVQMTLFVLSFAMVASMIAAIIDALSTSGETNETKVEEENESTKGSQQTLSVEEVDILW